ncbi:MAG: hypothetical protein CM15mP103_03850 [Gammaproteobacteria bacterium]|nr:MAG: hypothetical protein CM15mP103_03850 [Gammaproteobacteria bacterium]
MRCLEKPPRLWGALHDQPLLINNVEHNEVGCDKRSAKYGDAIMSCITFSPGVSLSVQAWYPILLQVFRRRDASGACWFREGRKSVFPL